MNFQFSQTYCSFPHTLISSHLINFLEKLERTMQWSLCLYPRRRSINGKGRSKIRQANLFVKLSFVVQFCRLISLL